MALSNKRAIKTIIDHPCVEDYKISYEEDNKVVLELKINVGIGKKWLKKGYSENGVKPIEPIDIVLFPEYPKIPPVIFLRDDFSANLPHMYCRNYYGKKLLPCYTDQNPVELLEQYGISKVIDQVQRWLSNAAHGELQGVEQDWEPVRREKIDSWLVVDSNFLRSRVRKNKDIIWRKATKIELSNEGRLFGVCHHERYSLKNLISDSNDPSFALTLLVYPKERINGNLFIDSKYRVEAVQNREELLVRAEQSGCNEELESQLNLLSKKINNTELSRPIPVWIILATNRPVNIRYQNSPIELSAFLLSISSNADLNDRKQETISYASLLNPITSKILKSISGLDEEKNSSWVLLGCGSLGSKIALHLARQGDAPRYVVDRARMSPHNYARHALIPNINESDKVNSHLQFFVHEKATGLANALRGFDSTSEEKSCDLENLDFSDSGDKPWDENDSFLVETTGSEIVANNLSDPSKISSRPQLIEASLMAAGKVGLFLIEGAGNNPSAKELQTDFYQYCVDNQELADLVFKKSGVKSGNVTIGEGCMTMTSVMSDATLSAMAAPMADMVSDVLINGFESCDGCIRISRTLDDNFSRVWEIIKCRPFVRLQDKTNSVFVSIHERVVSKIEEEIQKAGENETGGIIIGRFIEQICTFIVIDFIDPSADSEFTPTNFTLDLKGCKPALDTYVNLSEGKLVLLGTWHSHLADTGPSNIDLKSGEQIAENHHNPSLMLIKTPKRWVGLVTDSLIEESYDRTCLLEVPKK